MEALISSIQRYSIHDGPGIRTTVFFKGCGLKCRWCHNPECIFRWPVLQYHPQKCLRCHACVDACSPRALSFDGNRLTYRREDCSRCFRCTGACPSGALSRNGDRYTVDSLMEAILADRPFYENSGGGVTFSGGEAVLQSSFLREILLRCRGEGIHCTIDTAGFAERKNFADLSGLADLYLYDLKSVNEAKHREYTGAGNSLILENLRYISENRERIVIRIPVIPGFNDSNTDFEAMIRFLDTLKERYPVELLPYHNLAMSKYESLWLSGTAFAVPESGRMRDIAQIFERSGYRATASIA